MVNKIHYRWDFIGLSTDTKPTPAESPKVVNGSTYYESDTSKLYVFYKDTWYERKPLGGGGGGGGTEYTAGDGIIIANDEISVDTTTIQPKLTAGTNITIENNVISAAGGGSSYTAGNGIDITNNEISVDTTTIQSKLTAGTNISIVNDTISATDTTYSAFTGTDGTAAGTAGLVPAPATTDAGKFLKADGTWDTAGGGSGPTVVQTTGTSTTDVMSQNAVTSMVFADPANRTRVQIGANTQTGSSNTNTTVIGNGSFSYGNSSVVLGYTAKTYSFGATALGSDAYANAAHSIALGDGSTASAIGEMAIGTKFNYGYNSSNYRLLTGLYDPQSAHDAATKGYVDPTTDSSAPTTATVGRLGQIQIDTTNADAYMCVAVDTVTPTYSWKKITA